MALAEAGLEDMIFHFFPSLKPWSRDGHTWSMLIGGQEVRSSTDYLMGTDNCMFHQRDTCHNLDHYVVLGYLRGAPAAEHLHYLGSKIRSPL